MDSKNNDNNDSNDNNNNNNNKQGLSPRLGVTKLQNAAVRDALRKIARHLGIWPGQHPAPSSLEEQEKYDAFFGIINNVWIPATRTDNTNIANSNNNANANNNNEPIYTEKVASSATKEDVQACSDLFSSHYGVWQNGHQIGGKDVSGKRVKLSADRLRTMYLADDSGLVMAHDPSGKLVGHCICTKYQCKLGMVCWITQLVVHTECRGQQIAQKLLSRAVTPQVMVVGLVTSHPHAVRALEKASHSACSPAIMAEHYRDVIDPSPITYMRGREIICIDKQSVVNTQFFVDHSEIQKKLAEISDWRLGHLPDGYEFLAFCMRPVIVPLTYLKDEILEDNDSDDAK